MAFRGKRSAVMKARLRWALAVGFLLATSHQVIAQQTDDKPPLCTEPFCSYGPPRLTGDGMAAAAREIIRSATTVEFGFGTQDEFFDAFLRNNGFRFVTPYYVATSKGDARLIRELGTECVARLTEVNYDNAPSADFTGPFYLYKIEPPDNVRGSYKGILVFGGASVPRTIGMSVEERVERGDSKGIFYFFSEQDPCKPRFRFTFSIPGRGSKEIVKQFNPSLVGVGYYNSEFFAYWLHAYDLIYEPDRKYSLSWVIGPWSPDYGMWLFKRSGSAMLSAFSDAFDPFAVVNRQAVAPD